MDEKFENNTTESSEKFFGKMKGYRLHGEIIEDADGLKASRIYRYNDDCLKSVIEIPGDFNEGIEEIKYVYDKDGNLQYEENNIRKRICEYKFNENILDKILVYKKEKLYEYYTMFYENGRKTKQRVFSSSDSLKYELAFIYDKFGRRILKLKDNKFHCVREYGDGNLFNKIHLNSGENIYYIWEKGQTTFDYNMMFGC
jgi:hypothetical protein